MVGIARHQILIDALGINEIAIGVVPQLKHPAKDIVRPASVREKLGGIGAERLGELGNVAVVPADQDVLTVRPGAEVIRQFLEFFRRESLVDVPVQGFAQGLDGQERTVAVRGIGGGDEIIQFHRLGIHGEILKVPDIGLGALFAGGCQRVAAGGLFGMADDQDGGVAQTGRNLGKAGRGRQNQYQTGEKLEIHRVSIGRRAVD